MNTAALQLPPSDLQAESCQSLQCSSGYGTMTNVSAGGSIETICTSAGGELDGIMLLLISASYIIIVSSTLMLFSFVFVAYIALLVLQCFDAVGWAAGRASGL